MKTFLSSLIFLPLSLIAALGTPAALAAEPVIAPAAPPVARLVELDAFWRDLARTVREGDFDAYKATYHDDAVLVSPKASVPIGEALARWKPGFTDTRAGKIKADVQFRFGKRVGDATTAHETGIFLYSSTDASGKASEAYVHFEALLVKKAAWKMVMEMQKNTATKAEWEGLK